MCANYMLHPKVGSDISKINSTKKRKVLVFPHLQTLKGTKGNSCMNKEEFSCCTFLAEKQITNRNRKLVPVC